MKELIEEAMDEVDESCGWKAVKEYRDRLEEMDSPLADEYEYLISGVKSQQEAIRKGGYVNMFDKARVADVSRRIGFDEHADMMDYISAEGYIDMAEEAVE